MVRHWHSTPGAAFKMGDGWTRQQMTKLKAAAARPKWDKSKWSPFIEEGKDKYGERNKIIEIFGIDSM